MLETKEILTRKWITLKEIQQVTAKIKINKKESVTCKDYLAKKEVGHLFPRRCRYTFLPKYN